MDVDWHHELLAQLEFYWDTTLRPRLEGLTDEEYLWEPAQPAWTVRATPGGGTTIDFSPTPLEPPPVTTIAWRLCHVAGLCFWLRWSNHFDDGSFDVTTVEWPLTAAGGLEFLDEGYRRWHDALRAHPERFTEPTGPAEGPFADEPFATLVLHLTRELCHHGGEIGTLRDLYGAFTTTGRG
ncbi:DinB family protein [Actinomycetospora sp. OC33-EN08]|uniref:DinB family protein n=1 Tax=Actinomycetospora aurantiaca TaxID=3129233 RepID=A0ABU8MG41_9PSEU